MGFHVKKLIPQSVFIRFVLSFVIVGLLPLAFFTGIVLVRFSDEMEEREMRGIEQVIASLAETLNVIVRDLDTRSQSMYLYESANYGMVGDMIRNDAAMDQRSGYVLSEKYKGMRDFTRTMLGSSTYLNNVIFLDIKNGKAYESTVVSGKTFYTDFDFSVLPVYQAALRQPRAMVLSGVHTEEYYLRSSTQVITMARAFLDINALPEREVVVGMLLMDVRADMIGNIVGDLGRGGAIQIIGADGTSVYPVGAEQEQTFAASEQEASGRIFQESRVTMYRAIPEAQWTLFYTVDHQSLLASIKDLQRYAVWMIVLSACAALVMAGVFSRRLALPLRRITKQMRRVQNGDLTAQVEKYKADEVGLLAQGFNDMVRELQAHIERSYLAKLGQQEAELNELKMQIHPHFLYNTLEVIRMSAVDAEDASTADMIQALAEQLKYVIGEVSNTVTLARELEMVRAYIKLVSMRYGNIALQVNVPSDLLACSILKLSIQPVVENAVQHGLRPHGGGSIKVEARCKDGYLIVTVMDDGVGISEEQMTTMRKHLARDSGEERTGGEAHSIGLKNVHDRLRMTYGGESGLVLHSREGFGTVISIQQWLLDRRDAT